MTVVLKSLGIEPHLLEVFSMNPLNYNKTFFFTISDLFLYFEYVPKMGTLNTSVVHSWPKHKSITFSLELKVTFSLKIYNFSCIILAQFCTNQHKTLSVLWKYNYNQILRSSLTIISYGSWYCTPCEVFSRTWYTSDVCFSCIHSIYLVQTL